MRAGGLSDDCKRELRAFKIDRAKAINKDVQLGEAGASAFGFLRNQKAEKA